MRGIYNGTWGLTPEEEKGEFSFRTTSTKNAKIKLTYTKDATVVEENLSLNVKELKFSKKYGGDDKGIYL